MNQPCVPQSNESSNIRGAASLLIPLFIAVSFLTMASGYSQTTYTWTGNNSGNNNWGRNANWNPDLAPNSGNSAIVTDASIYPEVELNQEVTLTDLEIGSAITLVIQQNSAVRGLEVSGTLENAGLIIINNAGGSTGLVNYLKYSGLALNNTGTIVLTGATPGGTNRSSLLEIATGNENAGTISLINNATDGALNRNYTMNLAGAGTFTNAGSVNLVIVSSDVTRTATIQGADATYAQSGGVTRVGGGTAVNVGAVAIDAGTLTGAGSVTGTSGGVTIGDGSGSGDAVVSANTISASGTTVSTNSDIATLNFGSNLTLNSDARFELDINISDASTVTSDRLNITGSLTLIGNPELTLTNLGSDLSLAFGTWITIVDYTTTASGSFIYDGNVLDEGSTFMFGSNTFQISYAGNGITGAKFGGTDVILTAIPEPAATAILIPTLAALVLLRRVRNGQTAA